MPLHCPNCGTQTPDEARFCMSCGHERPQAGAPLPPPPPPPPVYAPGPARPSPVGQFFGRAFRGDWASAARAAAWPVGMLLVMAVALAVPSYGQEDGEVVVGWSDRLRIALALLLQAFGGGFEVGAAASSQYGGGSDGFGPGSSSDIAAAGGATLSLVPLTITVLWVGAVLIGARMLRTRLTAQEQGRTAGLEAAVRITLLATAGVLVLGLFAQPSIAGVVEVSSSPLLATLGALVLSLAVTAGVLQRDDLTQWIAQRPAAGAAVRALGTAVRALGAVLALCTLVGFIAYATAEDVDGQALLIALPILPNIGLMVLGLSWGVPVEYDVQGQVSYFGDGIQHGNFGLSELGDVQGGWAVTGAVALGVVCALTLALWTARRSADRREQVLTAAFFLAMYLLFTGFTGVSVDVSGEVADLGGAGGAAEVSPSVPDALLFGLLWTAGAVLAAPYLGRWVRVPGHPAERGHVLLAGYAPLPDQIPAPGHGTLPGQTPLPAQHAQPGPGPASVPLEAMATATAPSGPYTTNPAAAPVPAPAPERKSRVLLWVGTLGAAFLIGGGATAGVLLLQGDGEDTSRQASRDDKPAVAESNRPTGGASQSSSSPSPTPSASPSESAPEPSESPSAPETSASSGSVPKGFRQVTDSAGFSLAIPELWSRQTAEGGQITYAGSTGMEHLLIGVVQDPPYASSYENFLALEKNAKANQKDFKRLRLERNTFQGRAGAIWEYTYTDKQTGETLHAIDQGYIAENGTDYSIYTKARDRDWQYARKTFDAAVATWSLN
ncbi:zinc ribbon domain-containing protein [Streptomyces sp. ISL-98]|uniref:zinc-ribbon domain-containing protein n=1 Tax=Streptomyces sp. ISL-98 TaxID=2819192 RepID=UPI001BE5C2C4|nr:zinc-ribbon domain-containing protein [Streptomyces sp. ISL-98]MBT2506456.1 zinc ribbon domain-containing protein [Streptomyces sp. ISL-98]